MNYSIIFSKKALEDLDNIIEYYFTLNKTTALKYYKGIIETTEKLKKFPPDFDHLVLQ